MNGVEKVGVKTAWARVRVEVRDALELVLLPGLAALLPWGVCFALFRRMAHWRWLYRETCERALVEAQQRGVVGDDVRAAARWLHERRLVTLVDHADLYLSRWRSDDWMRHWLRVQGDWPPSSSGPGVLCTFHYGAGMWGLRHAARAGLRAHKLVAPLTEGMFNGRTVMKWYAHARLREVERALGRPFIAVAGSLRAVLRTLEQGEQVLAVIDVPADQVSASEPITLLGMQARAPRGLLRVAVEHRVPVTVYITLLNVKTGRRTLRIEQVDSGGNIASTEELMVRVFAHLEHLMQRDTAAWHFWSEAPRFFVR